MFISQTAMVSLTFYASLMFLPFFVTCFSRTIYFHSLCVIRINRLSTLMSLHCFDPQKIALWDAYVKVFGCYIGSYPLYFYFNIVEIS